MLGTWCAPCCGDGTGEPPCLCGDPCLYQVEVLSPLAAGPVPLTPCGSSPTEDTQYADEFLCHQCGDPYIFPGSSVPYLQSSGVSANAAYPSPYGGYWPRASAFCSLIIEPIDEADGNVVQQATITAQLVCATGVDGEPRFFIDVAFVASVAPEFFATKVRSIRKSSQIELSSLCRREPTAVCGGNLLDYKYAEWNGSTFGYVEIEADWNSVNGANWQTTSIIEQFNDDNYIGDCFDSLVDSFSASFKFTKRETCEVGCPCSKRGEGHTLYVIEEGGTQLCCPPGTTVLEGEGLCECEPNDERCTQGFDGGWYMSPESSEGWQDCGDVCVRFNEDCPP